MSIPSCPFPGLLPFQEKDAPFFFGRERETAELLLRLERSRFLAVIGVSGSGKSSLVHAGLKPELRLTEPAWRVVEMKPGGGPRRRLQSALDAAIANVSWSELLGKSSYGLADGVGGAGFKPGEKLLVIVDQFEEIFSYRRIGTVEAEEADLFVQQILRAGAEPGAPVYLMLTMRTDYLGQCALFRNLPEALNEGTYLVPRLTRHAQEEAIRSPLAVSGVEIEPAAVDHLLNAAEANRDELPVLQHLLKRLWEEWAAGGATGTIDHASSEKTGSWNDAIDLDAESVFEPLGAQEQEAVKLVFQRITEKGTGDRPIRTPCAFAELERLTSSVLSAGRLQSALGAFRARDVLVWFDEERFGDAIIDIPHECVTWRWSRLAGWIDEEDRNARRLAFIAESARAGTPLAGSALEEAGRLRPRIADPWVGRYRLSADGLRSWIDSSQRAAERARRRTRDLVIGLVFALLLFAGLGLWALQQKRSADASAYRAHEEGRRAASAKEDAIAQATRARTAEGTAKEEARRADTERASATQAQKRAEDSAAESQALAREGRVRLAALLGEHSRTLLATDPALALLLGLEAGYATTRGGEPRAPAADRALRRALASSGGLSLNVPEAHIGPLGPHGFGSGSGVFVSPNQQWLVTVGRFIEGNLWKANLRLASLKPPRLESEILKGAGEPVVFTPDGRWLATAAADGGILLWNLRSGTPGANPRSVGTRDPLDALAVSPDGKWLAFAPSLQLLDLSGAEPATTPIAAASGCLPDRDASSLRHFLRFSPDGRWLIAGGSFGSVGPEAPPPWLPCLIDLKALNPAASARVLAGHTRSVTDVIFSEGGRWMATYSRERGARRSHVKGDTTVRIWDLESSDPGREPVTVVSASGAIEERSVLMSPDNRYLLVGGESGVQVLDLSPAPKPIPIVAQDLAGTPIALGPPFYDGSRWLVTVLPGTEQSTLLWKVAPDKENPGVWDVKREVEPLARSSGLAVTGDQRWLAIGGGEGTVSLLDLASDDPRKAVRRFKGSGARVDGIELDRDGRHLGVVYGNSVRLWSLAQEQGSADPIVLRVAGASIAGGRWVIADGQRQVNLWDLDEAVPTVPSIAASGRGVEPLAVTDDARLLLSWDLDCRLRLWRPFSSDQPATLLWPPATQKSPPCEPWPRPVAAFSRDGRRLAAGFADGAVQVWDLTSSRTTSEKVHGSSVRQVSFSDDGRWLLTEGSDGQGCLWLAPAETKGAAPRCQDGVSGVRISGSAPWVIAAAGDRVRLWTVKAGDPWTGPQVIETGLKEVSGILIAPDVRWLVAYHNFDSLVMWRRAASAETRVTRLDPPRHMASIRLSPDGRWLAAGGGWGEVVVWDLAPVVKRMSFSPPAKEDLQQWGNLLSLYRLGAGAGMLAVWWRADGWKEIVSFVTPSSLSTDNTRAWARLPEGAEVSYSALSPGSEVAAGGEKVVSANGRWVVSLGTQTAVLARLRSQDLEALTCQTAARNLTEEEWKTFFPDQPYRKTCPQLTGPGER